MSYAYAVVAAASFRPRRAPVSITRYELRAYGAELGPSPYVRRRRSGANPQTLASTTSGTGCPAWLCHLCAHLQDTGAPLAAAQIMAQNARGR